MTTIFCFFLGSKDELWTIWIHAKAGNKYFEIVVTFLLLINPSLPTIQVSIMIQGDPTSINRPGWHHDITLFGLWRSQAFSFSIHDCIASCRGVVGKSRMVLTCRFWQVEISSSCWNKSKSCLGWPRQTRSKKQHQLHLASVSSFRTSCCCRFPPWQDVGFVGLQS